MGLQRWHVARGGLDLTDCPDERGEWVRWADVDALLAHIRAAVEVERWATPASPREECGCAECEGWRGARAALDALLGQEATDG